MQNFGVTGSWFSAIRWVQGNGAQIDLLSSRYPLATKPPHQRLLRTVSSKDEGRRNLPCKGFTFVLLVYSSH